MNENQEIQEINQEVAETALEVSNSGNVLIKIAVGVLAISAATAAGILLYRKHKKNKEVVVTYENVNEEEVVNEESTEE